MKNYIYLMYFLKHSPHIIKNYRNWKISKENNLQLSLTFNFLRSNSYHIPRLTN